MKLDELRQNIDAINEEIIALFGKRLKIVQEIARLKKHVGLSVYDPMREQEQIATLRDLAKDQGLNPSIIEEIFTLFFQYSKLKEWEIIDE